jgi:tetratricopeptide (TPR) repeat protein
MDGDQNVMATAGLKDWVLEAVRQHRFTDAEKALRAALEAPAGSTDLQFMLGTVLASSGKLDEAIHYLEQARQQLPDNVNILNNLGNALRLKGRAEEAVTHLRRALTIHPDSPDALVNLGLSLLPLGHADQAVQCARLALRLRPDNAEALFVLATALGEEGRPEEAIQCFEQVLRHRPGHPAALNGLALARRELGKLDDAIAGLRDAIAAAPEDTTLHTNLGLFMMENGDLAGGSLEYEWRLRRSGAARLNAPLWDGKPLAGRTLLLWADTGLADAIQLIRFAPMLRASAGRIVLACPAPLARLAASAPGIDQVVSQGEAVPQVHAYLPLTSLLNRLGIGADGARYAGPYLAVDPLKLSAMQSAFAGTGFKVGLMWNGGNKDRRRPIPLSTFAPLLHVPGMRFFSLEQGASAEIAASPFAGRLTDLSGKISDLADMAAAISQLDLVVTVDAVAAHIAGALGRPAWVLLPKISDWRWSGHASDSPWYPSALLYRQTQAGAWDKVVEQVAGALAVFGFAAPNDNLPPAFAAPIPVQSTPFLATLRQYRAATSLDPLVAGLTLAPQSPDLLFRLGALCAESGRFAEAQDYMMRLRRVAFDPTRVANLALAMAGDDLKIGLAWTGHDSVLDALLDVPGVRFFALTPRAPHDRITDLTPELTDFHRYAAALRNLDMIVTTEMGVAHLASALDRPAWLFMPPDAEGGWINRVIASVPCYAMLKPFWPEQDDSAEPADHRLIGEVARQALIGERNHRPETLNNLGVLLRRLGRLDDAVACYRRALDKRPDYSLALGNLGVALQDQGNLQEAIGCLAKALELKPGYADGHNNLATALDAAGLTDQAVLHYRRTLELKPDHTQALANLGNIARAAGRYDEAVRLQRRALEIRPAFPEALSYLGSTLRAQGDVDAGIDSFRRAIALKPDYADAHMGLAMALMAKGDIKAGAAEFEWRWRGWRHAKMPVLGAPLWDGQPLGDRTLLLWSEQGLGETIQFVRFAPQLRAFAGRIILACHPALVRLMTTAPGLDGVVSLDATLPAFDAHLPLMSAMHRVGTTLATIPTNLPYLAADPARIQALAPLINGDGIRIGLSWGSDSESTDGGNRSVKLDAMRQVLSTRGVSFYSLQRGTAMAELANSPFADRIVDLTPHLGDAADAAAAMSLLDLVITVDGTVAHLAGALDVNCWLMLPNLADWRWLDKRTESPWYRSMLLFRQAAPNDWSSVIEQCSFALGAGTAASGALQTA